MAPHRLAAAVATIAMVLGVAEVAAAANAAVSIKDLSFQPGSVTVGVGQSVTWTNLDGIKHSATADDGSFDTGIYEAGSRAVTFARAGPVAYHCTVHSFMHGTVTVLGPAPTPAPTPPSTPAPTPPPTAPPTRPPTPEPTVAPATTPPTTPSPTAAPSPSATPSPSAEATPTSTSVAQVSAPTAAPTGAATAGSRSGEGPGPLLLGGAAVGVAALVAIGLYIARRP